MENPNKNGPEMIRQFDLFWHILKTFPKKGKIFFYQLIINKSFPFIIFNFFIHFHLINKY